MGVYGLNLFKASICYSGHFVKLKFQFAYRDCCDRMLGYLNKYFDPRQVEDNYSLAIRAGVHGARLSHNHELQYYYA